MYFPVFIDLTKKRILVVGAGAIALRRIRILREFAGEITVVGRAVCPELWEMKTGDDPRAREAEEARPDISSGSGIQCAGRITICERGFQEEDLNGCDLVLAATDDRALNQEIAALCRERRIPVNAASDQSLCDFQFPSVVQCGEAVIGINASGTNHRLVKELRKKIENCVFEEGQGSKYPEI